MSNRRQTNQPNNSTERGRAPVLRRAGRWLCGPSLGFVCAATMVVAPASSADAVQSNSGLLAYACKNSTALYLLAASPDAATWDFTGGKPSTPSAGSKACAGNRDHCEPPIATALREFHEETRCAITLGIGGVATLRGPYLSGSDGKAFRTFLIEVPYVAEASIRSSKRCETNEKGRWAWVAHRELNSMPDLNQPSVRDESGRERAIEGAAAEAIRSALRSTGGKDPCMKGTSTRW